VHDAVPNRFAQVQTWLGAAISCVGWGLAGYCPGPALVGAGAGVSTALLFLPAMIAGSIVHRLIAERLRPPEVPSGS
jgi:uncharacterized membrane protein YedE/YeeE